MGTILSSNNIYSTPQLLPNHQAPNLSNMMSLQSTTLKGCTINGMPLRSTKRVVVLRAEPKETSTGQDSYSKIEAPVRDSIPDRGKPVSERNWGQEELNPALKADEALKPLGSDISAADAMRFAGAIPEVANSRLCQQSLYFSRKYIVTGYPIPST